MPLNCPRLGGTACDQRTDLKTGQWHGSGASGPREGLLFGWGRGATDAASHDCTEVVIDRRSPGEKKWEAAEGYGVLVPLIAC